MNSSNFHPATEHDEQATLIKWWALQCAHFGIPEHLLHAIPNGGARDPITGARLKAEGVRPGIPDLFLAVPRFGHAGLYIEMKRRKGGWTSNEQKAVIDDLTKQGYACHICYGWFNAKTTIEQYLTRSSEAP